MTKSNFEPALALVLAHEGGFVDHPRDPGGPTNKGVTQRVYDAYRQSKAKTLQTVKLISMAEVGDIYRKEYWNAVKGDDLPTGLDYAVFDFAVNSGVSRSVRNLQLCCGVAADGSIGNVTLQAVAKAKPADLIIALCERRMVFLRSLATFDAFGKGWTRRVIGNQAGAQDNDTGVLDHALKMAAIAAGNPTEMPAPPSAIGSLQGEAHSAKSTFAAMAVTPSEPMSYAELKAKRWAD